MVSSVVPFLVEPTLYKGSQQVAPKRNYNGDFTGILEITEAIYIHIYIYIYICISVYLRNSWSMYLLRMFVAWSVVCRAIVLIGEIAFEGDRRGTFIRRKEIRYCKLREVQSQTL